MLIYVLILIYFLLLNSLVILLNAYKFIYFICLLCKYYRLKYEWGGIYRAKFAYRYSTMVSVVTLHSEINVDRVKTKRVEQLIAPLIQEVRLTRVSLFCCVIFGWRLEWTVLHPPSSPPSPPFLFKRSWFSWHG